MPVPYAITTHIYEGKRLSGWSYSPGETKEQAREIYDRKIRYYEGVEKAVGTTTEVKLLQTEGKKVIEEKTIKA